MALYTIRIDDVINVFDAESRPGIVAKAKKALRAGSMVTWEDGTKEWLEFYHRTDTTKTGSQRYVWDKRGDKVLADVISVRTTRSGETSKRQIGTKYVEP